MHYVRSITGVLSDHLFLPGPIEVHGSLYLCLTEAHDIESLGDCNCPEGWRQVVGLSCVGARIGRLIKSDFLCKSALRKVRLGSHRWLSFG
jgi:hypothetical protein